MALAGKGLSSAERWHSSLLILFKFYPKILKLYGPKSLAFIYSCASRRHGKGSGNKALKLPPAKEEYTIWAKTNNNSSKIIAAEMKVSVRTVNRIHASSVSSSFIA
jgi:hypothetical protein